jgi:Family of unknown function (DUF5335)
MWVLNTNEPKGQGEVMTQEIGKTEWKDYFDRISKTFLDWETYVQVISDDTGSQMLSEGLPFNGATYDTGHGRDIMALSIGAGTQNHQTHNIKDPNKVAFEPSGHGPGGTLDIEDASGTKTLINFIRPMPGLAKYARNEVLKVN